MGSEEGSSRLFDDILVHTLRRVVHDHSAGLVVNLGVYLGVSDQVHDPFLSLIFAQAKTLGQVAGILLAMFLVSFDVLLT